MSKQQQAFTPYANEADVLHLGQLMLENRLDRVSISGDVDLTADQAGLALARSLHAVLAAVVAELERRDLPATLPPPATSEVDNPFL